MSNTISTNSNISNYIRTVCQNTFSTALPFVKATAGKFASVVYTNAQGETKSYVVRTGVKKHLRGGTKPLVENSVTVYSVTSKGYRTFKAEGIKSVKCGSLVWSK